MSSFKVVPSIYIGDHVAKSSTFLQTIKNVINLENRTAFQMFVKNKLSNHPMKDAENSDILNSSELLKKNGIKLVIHASYVYNLCGSSDLLNIENSNKNIIPFLFNFF